MSAWQSVITINKKSCWITQLALGLASRPGSCAWDRAAQTRRPSSQHPAGLAWNFGLRKLLRAKIKSLKYITQKGKPGSSPAASIRSACGRRRAVPAARSVHSNLARCAGCFLSSPQSDGTALTALALLLGSTHGWRGSSLLRRAERAGPRVSRPAVSFSTAVSTVLDRRRADSFRHSGHAPAAPSARCMLKAVCRITSPFLHLPA